MTDSDLYQDEGPPEVWEKDFLEAFINDYGIVGKAAQSAGVHPNAVATRARNSKRFSDLYDAAKRMVDDTLEFENVRRALEPNERPVFQRGVLVGVVREWDTKHLEWLLERRMPEKYHLPTRIEFGQGTDGAINFKLSLGDTPGELGTGDDDQQG